MARSDVTVTGQIGLCPVENLPASVKDREGTLREPHSTYEREWEVASSSQRPEVLVAEATET